MDLWQINIFLKYAILNLIWHYVIGIVRIASYRKTDKLYLNIDRSE